MRDEYFTKEKLPPLNTEHANTRKKICEYEQTRSRILNFARTIEKAACMLKEYSTPITVKMKIDHLKDNTEMNIKMAFDVFLY